MRIIAPFAPGGPTDLIARILAAHLGKRLGGNFIVENRAGAGGNIGTSAVAKAEPDGYTLLVTSNALVVNPSLYKRVQYDPVRDFAPLSELGAAANVFIANPATRLTSIADLVARAKADPAAFSYATAGIGTTPHLSGELMKLEAGIQMTHVPYGGAGPAIQAVLAGTTPIACASIPPVLAQIKSGALTALAVTSRLRWPDVPDVPTMIEQGLQRLRSRHVPSLPGASRHARFDRGCPVPNNGRDPEGRGGARSAATGWLRGARERTWRIKARIDEELPKWRG